MHSAIKQCHKISQDLEGEQRFLQKATQAKRSTDSVAEYSQDYSSEHGFVQQDWI